MTASNPDIVHTDRRRPEVITPEQLAALEESMRSMALEMPQSASAVTK